VDYTLTPFTDASEIDASKFKLITRPPLVRLKDMPEGAVIDCTPLEVTESTNKSIKQPLLIVELTGKNSKVAIPMQAALRNVLLDKADKCTFIGKRVLIRKAGERVSTKYKDDNGDPRKFSIYDVAVAK